MNKNELCTQLENFEMIRDHIEGLLNLTKADEEKNRNAFGF